jgi:hypothetical protein
MASRLRFSQQQQSLGEIAAYHADVQTAIYEFFAGNSAALFLRYTGSRVDEARERSLKELHLSTSLSVLSSVEASVRLDYLRRVYGRRRDPLSKAMRALYRRKSEAARLEDELLVLWREQTEIPRMLLGELIGAFKFRHWLAHGRYWTPRLGRRYDYETVFEIAHAFVDLVNDHGRMVERSQS